MTTAKPQISLYNTLTRSKAPFVPMDATNVRLYACGPTVYDFAHIGNGRAAIVFDLLFRVLRHVYGPEHVTYVRNITDVDDKINARALRDHPDLPLNEAIRKVTETTAAQYQKDVAALGCLEPSVQPRATENIDEMQAMIGTLIQRSHAYAAGGEVLFRTRSMPDYGQLSGRNLEDNLAGARIAVDAHKEDPADFVLWKLSSPEEPGWDSPWGRGRPGWHIECSAMSERYLGKTFDIHGGGLDLIFPHHENEIAQSRCAHGSHAMANVWMHNGFLMVEGQKMSKSLGNFFTIHQLLETEDFGGRKWPGEVLRLAMLMTSYREPIDFTVRRLEEALTLLERWERAAGDAEPAAQLSSDLVERLVDDLDTPAVINRIHTLILEEGRAADGLALAALMGITVKRDVAVDDTVATQIAARLAALNAKDFAEADRIRNDLAEQGIALMDYKDEAGQRQTKWEVKR
ncbi:cysteine--tRNA ligase [Devosia sp. 63-57]|uniref:cysteine--tRNA ligase n=1 Tax=Devosia sp. 63-57 TaxID=1895751 RepID=UPI00086E7A6B|nr:cysteine--tRNA ligase [Devosia sp. 63-57]ODT47333.1 MAG: cysteine--tRNA ligase [Pelagibacterium sp. SCN 63-126]ODU87010.1 MAG: cysteine--tRNA ligase [Pelagibacterium sp. SCN 63-17]OJX42959.1 MAG: cysteine--tRNA ligase [Devosia sp. 63-57]